MTTAQKEGLINPAGIKNAGEAMKPAAKIVEKSNSTMIDAIKAQAADPEKYRREKKINPEVSDPVKDIGRDIIYNHYQAILDVQKGNPNILNDPAYGNYSDFLRHFQERYKAVSRKDISQASADELKAFARSLMDQDRYQILAVKLAEEQQASLQASTGVEVLASSIAEKPGDIDEEFVYDRAGNKEATTKEHTKKRKLTMSIKTPLGTIKIRRGRMDPANDLSRALVRAEKTAMQEEGEKSDHTFSGATFQDGPITLNLNATIEGRGLDLVQKAYIHNIGKENPDALSKLDDNGQAIEPGSQKDIRDRVNDIVALRMGVYARNDRYLTRNTDLNIIRIDRAGRFVYERPPNSPRLGVGEISGVRQRVEVGAGTLANDYLRGQIDTIQKVLNEDLNKILQEQKQGDVLNHIEGHITRLAAEAKKQKDPEAAKKIDKDIEDLNRKLQLAKEKERLAKAQKEAQESLTEAEDTLDTTAFTDPVLPTVATLRDLYELNKKEQAAIEEHQAEKARLKAEIDAIKAELRAMDPNMVKQMGKAGTVVKEPTDEQKARYKRYEDRLAGTPGVGGGAAVKGLEELFQEVDKKLQDSQLVVNHINKRVPQSTRDQLARRDTAEKAVLDATAELDTQKGLVRKSLLKDPANPSAGEYTAKELEDQVKTKEKQKKIAEAPNVLTVHQLEAYQELQGRLQPGAYAEIQKRVLEGNNSSTARNEIRGAQATYKEYPVAYLRTLQILYGPNITLPNTTSREAFRKATLLFPPEMFMQQLQQRGITLVDVHDARMWNDRLLQEVNGTFITNIYDTLIAQGEAGTLAQPNDIDRARLDEIEQSKAEDLTELKKEQDEKVEDTKNAVIPNYELSRAFAVLPNMDRTQINAMIRVVSDGIRNNLSDNVIFTNLDMSYTGATRPDFNQMIEKAREVKKIPDQSQEALRLSLLQNHDIDSATVLAAAVFMTDNAADRQDLLAMINQQMTLTEIVVDISLRPTPPAYMPYLAGLAYNASGLPANHTSADLRREIQTHLLEQKRDQYIPAGAPAGTVLPPEIMQEIADIMGNISANYEKFNFDETLRDMDFDMFHYTDVNDLTLQLITYNQDTMDNAPYYKMMAEEIDKRRRERTGTQVAASSAANTATP